MKYSVLGFSQEMAMKTSLDLTDLVLLKYINDACARVGMIHIVDEDTVYTWLSHKKIMEDLPIMRISEGTLKNRLSRLKQTGYIQSITNADKQGRGSRTYYGLTEVTMMLIYTPEETMTGSRENDVVTRPGHVKMTSNSLVENDSLLEKGISSKDEIHQKPSSFLHAYKKSKQPNLYTRCLNHIDNFSDNIEVKQALRTFLDSLSEMGKLKGETQFIGILKKLWDCSTAEQLQMINTSIEKGYGTFYKPTPRNGGKTGHASVDIEHLDYTKMTRLTPEQKRKLKEDIANDRLEKF